MRQRGITLIGLLFWAIVIAFVGIVAAKIVPTVNEFMTIKRTIKVVAEAGGGTVPEIPRGLCPTGLPCSTALNRSPRRIWRSRRTMINW